MAALLIIIPGLAIAAWLAWPFLQKGEKEKGVVVFLSTTIAPFVVWYLVKWIVDETDLGGSLYDVLGGLTDLLPGFAMVGTFVALCLRWARRAQSIEVKKPPPVASVPQESQDARARLESLEALKRDGLITDEEYAAKRAEILARL